ncbi:hypothetical protein ACN47E_001252 [Coniothyrium glycines]
MPQPPVRAMSQKELPPSVESAYYRKCIDLRRRINDIEENNDGTRQRITRLNRGIQKMRLERAFLLEQINKHMEYNVDDSDRSSSPPPTPTDKPLRSKRSHNRKGTPPPSGGAAVQQSPGSAHHSHAPQMLQTQHINPMSSAQSTPDPGRQGNSYFGAIGAGPTASSPHAAVNGGPTLPPLHSLPPLQPQTQPAPAPRTAFFDPAYDGSRPAPTEPDGEAGSGRAYSGAQQPSAPTVPVPADEPAAPQNGDTEMTDAGFTAVNR